LDSNTAIKKFSSKPKHKTKTKTKTMKRALIASILGIAGSVVTTYGQGIITFGNYVSTSYLPVVYNSNSSLAPAGDAGLNVDDANVEVQLFYANGTYGSVASFLTAATAGPTAFIDPTINPAGTVAGGTGPGGYYADSTPVTFPWTALQTETFYVEAWETSGTYAGGGTYSSSHLFGASGLWTEVAAPNASANGIQPSSLPAAGFAGGPPLTVISVSVPEPTTLALAGLGSLVSLVAFRRKQV